VLGYDEKGFVVTQAVISSRKGEMLFGGWIGQENAGIDGQKACVVDPSACKKVPMYSVDSYFDEYVQGNGPVNILQIDVEGWDFDVLFGASSVLDRTQYLEFEYHEVGPWGKYHLPDTVRLLDHKGFTCYWSGKSKLWRITGCYFDVYNTFHGWSNVACVHRTYEKLALRMEALFQVTIASVK
jgi:FkbM family methyltransferase